MAIYWWLAQLFINYTQGRRPKFWRFYVKFFISRHPGTFEFGDLFFIDKWVFVYFYNLTGFEYFSFRFRKMLKFIFNRAFYFGHAYNLSLHAHKVGAKNIYLDLGLKTIVRDYNLSFNYCKFLKNQIFTRTFPKPDSMVKFLNLYVVFYHFYAQMYYYLVSSFQKGIKTYDWEPINNYFTLFVIVFGSTQDSSDLIYVNTLKISGFYYFNTRYDLFYYRFKKTLSIGDSLKIAYYEKLVKTKLVYTNLYKSYFNFKVYNAAVQNFTISKFKADSYVLVNTHWKGLLKRFLKVKFRGSSVTKHINLKSVEKYTIYYIRKNKIFNKGRYSRNRQLYRTGVYWCLWLNIMIVYGLYLYFYRFVFNFGYIWWGLGFFVFSFIFSRAVQNDFYNINNLMVEFIKTYTWLGFLVTNLFTLFHTNWKRLYGAFVSYLHSNVYVFSFLNNNIWFRFFRSVNWFSLNFGTAHHQRFAYIWEYFVGEDSSFLKYKSIIHWFRQLWKMLTTY